MIKLTAKFGTDVFYFQSLKDCEAFQAVFKGHWCEVPWNEPEEVPNREVPGDAYKDALIDPKKRADDNLVWGFNLVRLNCPERQALTPEKRQVIQLIKDINKRNIEGKR